MVDVSTQVVRNPAAERMAANQTRILAFNTIPGIRVVPSGGEGFTEDDMRRLLRHPKSGGFRETGSIEWPNDTFTQRRLAEGCIKLADEKDQQEPEKESTEKEHRKVK